MADRQIKPQQQSSVVVTAAFFLVVAMVAPALAASDKQIPCADDTLSSGLEVPVQALVTQLANNDISAPPTSLLAPLAEAAIREAFDGSDSVPELPPANHMKAAVPPPVAGTTASPDVSPTDNDSSSGPVPNMNTRLPGVSDEALSRYKKQMYRRDI